jgi:hypothetical protein
LPRKTGIWFCVKIIKIIFGSEPSSSCDTGPPPQQTGLIAFPLQGHPDSFSSTAIDHLLQDPKSIASFYPTTSLLLPNTLLVITAMFLNIIYILTTPAPVSLLSHWSSNLFVSISSQIPSNFTRFGFLKPTQICTSNHFFISVRGSLKVFSHFHPFFLSH